jgi:hypothetical protein
MNGKCLCGYEYIKGIKEDGSFGVLLGDVPFGEIKGSFEIQSSNPYEYGTKVYLAVCPKCGTVRTERKWF